MPSSEVGVTLKYSGIRASELQSLSDESNAGLQAMRFEKLFSNFGALVIRYHLGQGQRAACFSQLRPDYADKPIERPAPGHDQADLFIPAPDYPRWVQDNFALEEMVAWSLGRSKLLNDRAQPLVHTNKFTFGEQGIWDIIHTPIWGVGRDLQFQLEKQGFFYVPCISGKESDYDLIAQALRSKRFTITDQILTLKDQNQIRINLMRIPTIKVRLALDDTFQANGMLVTNVEGGAAPLGWMLHVPTGNVLNVEDCEDLMRVMTIARGGFYELTAAQQNCLLGGRLKNKNGQGLYTQNQTFNAMADIFTHLAQSCGFDPTPLIQPVVLAHERLQRAFRTTDVLDDFLVGVLLTEMAQHLMVTQPHSARAVLPRRFTDPFYVAHNNAKAIAHAYELTDGAGRAVVQNAKLVEDARFLDLHVKGELLLPSFENPRHAAAVLAASILTLEQMLLEQIIPQAFAQQDFSALETFFKASTLSKLKAIYVPAQHGLQNLQSEELVLFIRAQLKTQMLIELCQAWTRQGQFKLDDAEKATEALTHFFYLAQLVQRLPQTSALARGSRGVVFVLSAMLYKVFPELAKQLAIDPAQFDYAIQPAQSPEVPVSDSTSSVAQVGLFACPFAGANRRMPLSHQPVPQVVQSAALAPAVVASRNTLFAKAAVPLVVAGAVASFAVGYMLT